MEIIQGGRCGAFVVFVDQDGLRHAVRLGSVLCLSDADHNQDTTLVTLPGGRVVLVQQALDTVLSWFR